MSEPTNPSRYSVDEARLRESLSGSSLEPWIDALLDAVESRGEKLIQGLLPQWQTALHALPDLPIASIDLDHESGVAVLTAEDVAADTALTNEQSTQTSNDQAYQPNEAALTLESTLKKLSPWRKGPFRFAHVKIDTEWRSDWKWNRVYPNITPLENRTVLDVGCGNGYHMWRMRAQGAASVLGIDPGLLFMMQFQAAQKYINDSAVNILPLTMETLPSDMRCFDTTFSMGVLYHRKDPHAHLLELMRSLRPGGELVLETLVAIGEDENELKIAARYARMKNIWSLPSVPLLARWMHEAGFTNVRCVSVDITSKLEQRTTPWMPYESLNESLDPEDPALTVEGLPRPRRAVMIGNSPARA